MTGIPAGATGAARATGATGAARAAAGGGTRSRPGRPLRTPPAADRADFATVAAGDCVVHNGRRRTVAAVLRTPVGFLVQFPDATAPHILVPPEVCEIDGRPVRLDDIPADACYWCHTIRRLVSVGRYTAPSGHVRTVYACTNCVSRRALIPLAGRADDDTDVRYRRGRMP